MTIEIKEVPTEDVYMPLEQLYSNNVIDENEGICEQCETVSDIILAPRTIFISRNLKINNIETYTCKHCDAFVGLPKESFVKVKEEIEFLKHKRPTVNELLSRNDESSYRWCDSMLCACAGAANCSGQLSSYLYTKRDWILWKEQNPQVEGQYVKLEIKSDTHMPLVMSIKRFFGIGLKDSKSIVLDGVATIWLDYSGFEQESKQKDLKNILTHFENLNFEVNFEEKTQSEHEQNYFCITVAR